MFDSPGMLVEPESVPPYFHSAVGIRIKRLKLMKVERFVLQKQDVGVEHYPNVTVAKK